MAWNKFTELKSFLCAKRISKNVIDKTRQDNDDPWKQALCGPLFLAVLKTFFIHSYLNLLSCNFTSATGAFWLSAVIVQKLLVRPKLIQSCLKYITDSATTTLSGKLFHFDTDLSIKLM